MKYVATLLLAVLLFSNTCWLCAYLDQSADLAVEHEVNQKLDQRFRLCVATLEEAQHESEVK